MIIRKPVLYIVIAILALVLVCLLFLLHVGFGTLSAPRSSENSVIADQKIFHANEITFEIADTPAKQQLGLGGRNVIPDDYGMLFPFEHDTKPGFWMKGMLQPIDIIWLSDKGTVVAIDANVPVSSFPSVLYPPSPIRYVLETRSGFAAQKGWVVGATIPLPLPYGKIVSH